MPPHGQAQGLGAQQPNVMPLQCGQCGQCGQGQQQAQSSATGDAHEVLRNVPNTLPVPQDVAEPQAALRAGDWLSELMPLISDVSEGASTWKTASQGRLLQMASVKSP